MQQAQLRRLNRRKALASTVAHLLPQHARQAFVYDRTFRNDIEAVAYPVLDTFGRLPDFLNPSTYIEKLRGLWLIHPNPLMSLVTDKVAVRSYFARFDLPFAPVELFSVHDRPEDLDVSRLPPAA